MNAWLLPATAASLLSSVVIFAIYIVVYRRRRDAFVALWLWGWGLYSCRHAVEVLSAAFGASRGLWALSNEATVASALLLLLAALRLVTDRSYVRPALAAGAILTAWIIFGSLFVDNFAARTAPIYFFAGSALISTGLVFYRYNRDRGFAGGYLLVGAMLLWGLHKFDYPFLRHVTWFAPWGFLAGAFFDLLVGIGILMTIFETWERKAAELSERFRLFLNSSQDAIFVVRPSEDCGDGVLVEVNDAACRRLGYSREELLGMSLSAIDAPSSREIIPERLKRGRHPGHFTMELEHQAKDGTAIPVEVSAHAFTLDNRPALLAVARDIRDRKAAERRLRESQEQLLTVLDGLDSMVYVADMDTHEVLYLNEYARKIAGDAIGQPCWAALQKGQTGPCPFCSNDRLLTPGGKPGAGHAWEFQNTRDGRWYSIHDKAIRWVDGRLVRLEIATDITERKQMEARLRQSQKMEAIGVLAGGIAHDFNNILCAILGYADLAFSRVSGQEALSADLSEIIKASKRASELVRQILTFSRSTEFEKRILELQPVVKESLKMLRGTLPSTIAIETRVDAGCRPVFGDVTQIQQVLINLCTNAYHAMRAKGGTLTVGLDGVEVAPGAPPPHPDLVPGAYVRLSVRDTGCGMEKEVLERIFEPYFTTKSQDEGTGMGLAIVHGIVNSHGGAVIAKSRPEEGSTFEVYFPVAKEDKPVSTPEIEDAPVTAKAFGRILLIDDDLDVVRMGERVLRHIGCEVRAYPGSREALEAFSADVAWPDAVITDQVMPGMTGLELAREMLDRRPDLPVILATGFSETADAAAAQAAGVRALVMKPFTLEEFSRILGRVLPAASPAGTETP